MRWRRRLVELSLVIGLVGPLTYVLISRTEPPLPAAAPATPSILAPVASFPTEPGRRGRQDGPPAPERSDLSEGRPGTPLGLRFEVLDPTGKPVPGARIDVWHADAQGVYSNPPETFCRGAQRTDDQGRAAFTTIRPGGEGRREGLPHVHFTVKTDDGMHRGGAIDVPTAEGPALDTPGLAAALEAGPDGTQSLRIRAELQLPDPGSCGPEQAAGSRQQAER